MNRDHIAVEVDPAEQAGYDASVRGAAPWDNPYQPGTLGFHLWDSGWDCANAAKGARSWA